MALGTHFILHPSFLSRSFKRNFDAHHHLEITSIALYFLLGMQSIKLAAGVLVVLDWKCLAPKGTR